MKRTFLQMAPLLLCVGAAPAQVCPSLLCQVQGGAVTPLERQDAAAKVKAHGFIVASGSASLQIAGKSSPVRFPHGAPVAIVLNFSSDPADLFHLRRLTPDRKARYAVVSRSRATPIGASGATEAPLPLRFEKDAAVGGYRVEVGTLPPGEYAIGRVGGRTLYCFGVD